MAAFSITCKSLSPKPLLVQQPFQALLSSPKSVRPTAVRFPGELDRRRRMSRMNVVTRAGPSSSQFVFAFVFPLSLLAITIFTAFRIGDRLDQKFLEELAMDEATREGEEADGDDSEVVTPRKEEPALPRTRNRPKREV